MKLQTLLITTFALTLSFSIAEENGADPYKDDVGTQPRVSVSPSPGPFIYTGDVVPNASTVAAAQTPTVRNAVRVAPQASSHETLSLCYEDFSLPMVMMADIQQKHLTDAALYEYIQKSLGTDPEKDPVRREIFVILRVKPGFSATTENEVTITNPDSKGNSRVGYRINLESSGSDQINLRFKLNNTVRTDSSNGVGDGKEADKPLVYTEGIEATVALSDDTPHLIGTVNRAASAKPGSGSAKRVLLGFITASPVK